MYALRVIMMKDKQVVLSLSGAPNNGMHPTANSAALIRETPCLMR